MKLGLRHKLIRGFVLILFMMAALTLANLCTSRTIQADLQEGMRLNAEAANMLANLSSKVGLVHANTLLHLHATSTGEMQLHASSISEAEDEIHALLDALENTLQSDRVRYKLREFRFAWGMYSSLRDELVLPASAANRKQEALSIATKEGTAGVAAQTAFDALEELREANAAAASEHLASTAHRHAVSQTILLALALLAVIPVLAFGVRISSQVVAAVDIVGGAARLVAAGDADWSVTLETGDELQSLAESLNAITRNLRKLQAAKRETTEHLQREIRERRHAQEILSIARERLAVTLDRVGDGVITTDRDGRVAFMNHTAAELTGWDQRGAAGRSLREILHILDRETRAPCEDPIEKALGSDAVDEPDREATLVTRDGAERTIAYSGVPIRDSDGHPAGAFLILRDITEHDNSDDCP